MTSSSKNQYKIHVIGEQELHLQTIEHALENDLFTTVKNDDADAVIYIAIGNNSLPTCDDQGCKFLITDRPSQYNDDFARTFKAPIRIGQILDSIRSYLEAKKQSKPISLGKFDFIPAFNKLIQRAEEKEFQLTEKESAIISFLAENNAQPVEREKLLQHVWGYADDAETHTVETHIYRLRQKIEQDPADPKFLRTNEYGYFLNLS